MEHAEWARFETWSTKSLKQKKKCCSCGISGQGFVEVEDQDGIGWACPACFGEDLTGGAAIDYAELHGLKLSKYADPIEGHRADLDPDAARKIAMEDPSLIYIKPTT